MIVDRRVLEDVVLNRVENGGLFKEGKEQRLNGETTLDARVGNGGAFGEPGRICAY